MRRRIGEERFDLAPQRLVLAARVAQECRALAFVARERVVIQPLDALPAIGRSWTDHTTALIPLIGKGLRCYQWYDRNAHLNATDIF